MNVAGVDPGLASSGLVLVVSEGPALPALVARLTARAPGLDAMAAAVLAWLAEHPAELVAVEGFEHRGWLGRTISTAPMMGRLVERVVAGARALGCAVVEVPAGVSKAGYPKAQRDLGRLLPLDLRNGHERSAYLAASVGAAFIRCGGAA